MVSCVFSFKSCVPRWHVPLDADEVQGLMCGLWQGVMGGGFLPVPLLSSLVCVSVRERWGDFTCRPDFVLPLSVPSLCPGGGLDFVPPSFAGRMSAGGASPVPSQPPHPEIGIVTPPSSCIIFFFPRV